MTHDPLLNGKELAAALRHHPGFISAMRAAGFLPSAGLHRYRLADAVEWLNQHPEFRYRSVYRRKKCV